METWKFLTTGTIEMAKIGVFEIEPCEERNIELSLDKAEEERRYRFFLYRVRCTLSARFGLSRIQY